MSRSSESDDNEVNESLLRLPAVVRMTGLAKSTIYKHVALRQVPAPVSLVGRAVACRMMEVVRWNQDRPACPPSCARRVEAWATRRRSRPR